MTAGPAKGRYYPVFTSEPRIEPGYDRVVRASRTAELRHDLAAGLGPPGYRLAAEAELNRRMEAGR